MTEDEAIKHMDGVPTDRMRLRAAGYTEELCVTCIQWTHIHKPECRTCKGTGKVWQAPAMQASAMLPDETFGPARR